MTLTKIKTHLLLFQKLHPAIKHSSFFFFYCIHLTKRIDSPPPPSVCVCGQRRTRICSSIALHFRIQRDHAETHLPSDKHLPKPHCHLHQTHFEHIPWWICSHAGVLCAHNLWKLRIMNLNFKKSLCILFWYKFNELTTQNGSIGP